MTTRIPFLVSAFLATGELAALSAQVYVPHPVPHPPQIRHPYLGGWSSAIVLDNLANAIVDGNLRDLATKDIELLDLAGKPVKDMHMVHLAAMRRLRVLDLA